jgi:uncharacterized membrane protein YfcA
MDPLLLLSGAGLLAGAMNALAGGGSFISLPALIAVGVPPVLANASSTVALFPGGVAAAWAYRSGLGPVGSVPLRTLFIVTLVGGVTGALLLLWTPTRAFDVVLPWLLLLATLALAFGRRIGESLRSRWRIRPSAVLICQLGLAIYGGYFGGAVGIMMVAVWGLLDSQELKSLNAPRMLLATSANGMAVLTFVLAHAVAWQATLVMLLGATVGGYVGAQIGNRATAHVIRIGTLLVTTGISITFFVRAYF